MSRREKIIDDLARAAGETVGLVNGLASEAKSTIRAKIDTVAQSINLVPREDFDRLELMLVKCREEQEQLKTRIETLENLVLSAKKK